MRREVAGGGYPGRMLKKPPKRLLMRAAQHRDSVLAGSYGATTVKEWSGPASFSILPGHLHNEVFSIGGDCSVARQMLITHSPKSSNNE